MPISNVLNQSKLSMINEDSKVQNIFDVVSNYHWSPSLLNADIKQKLSYKIPYIDLLEYELEGSFGVSAMRYWVLQGLAAFNENKDPYYGLYTAKPTGGFFRIPYFGAYHHTINQTWQPKDRNNIGDFLKDIAEKFSTITGIINEINGKGTPFNAGVEYTDYWSGNTKAQYPVSFMLFNTIGSDTIAEWKRNNELIQRLNFAALPDKRSSVVLTPPCIYKIDIPGVRMSPAASIQNLTIENVGNITRELIDGVPINIPDAYKVTLNIQELIAESRQILNQVQPYTRFGDPGYTINALVSDQETSKIIQELKNKQQEDNANYLNNVTKLNEVPRIA